MLKYKQQYHLLFETLEGEQLSRMTNLLYRDILTAKELSKEDKLTLVKEIWG